MVQPDVSPVVNDHVCLPSRKVSNGVVRRWAARILLRTMLAAHRVMWKLLRMFRGTSQGSAGPFTFLLTGTFYSEGWILNHLRPLANSPACARIWLVSNLSLPTIPKVTNVPVSNGLKRLLGQTPARLLVFVITAIRCRPDFVGGFHLLLNGLSASLVAQLMHSRSIYFCGGG